MEFLQKERSKTLEFGLYGLNQLFGTSIWWAQIGNRQPMSQIPEIEASSIIG
jgi:hypothetical protein